MEHPDYDYTESDNEGDKFNDVPPLCDTFKRINARSDEHDAHAGMDGEPFMCDDYQIDKHPMLRTLMPMDSLEILRKRLDNEQYACMAMVHDPSDPADACMLSQMLSVSEEDWHAFLADISNDDLHDLGIPHPESPSNDIFSEALEPIKFVPDSGATMHMVNDPTYLTDLQTVDSDHLPGVQGIGGTNMSIQATSNMVIEDTIGRKLVLSNVLFVPELQANEISANRNFRFLFASLRVQV